MATVDVIVPAYNAERFLAAALKSVVEQTFTDWRIVLVDDGSTDETASIASGYAEQLQEKMLFLCQENRGVSSARNNALRHASAKYVAMLDADDLWLPDRLKHSLARMHQSPEAGLCYGLITRIDVTGKHLGTFTGNPPKLAEGLIARSIYLRAVELPCSTVTIRRACLDVAGQFNETMHASEDRDLWLRIARHFPVVYVPEVTAYYRMSPSSASANYDRMLQAQTRFLNQHEFGFRTRRMALARSRKQYAEVLAGQAKPWAALGNALHALVLYPFALGNMRTAGSLLLHALGLHND